MGTFSITIGTTAAPATRSKTVADALFASTIIPALSTYYGQIKDAGTGQMRDRTNAELVDALFDSLVSDVQNIVKRGQDKSATDAISVVAMT